MKRHREHDDGVSPVIGTILLVAITVVLVAIISASFMGIADDIGSNHIVGVNVIPGESNELLVTVVCGQATDLHKIAVYNSSQLVDEVTFTSVGVPISFKNGTSLKSGAAAISIVGEFDDGNQTLYSGKVFIK